MFHAVLFGSALAASLVLAACQHVEYTEPLGQITIQGDDGTLITALTLENALEQSTTALKDAEARGDKSGANDWKAIAEKITALKKDSSTLLDEAKATGTLEISTNDYDQSVYTWTASSVGFGANGHSGA